MYVQTCTGIWSNDHPAQPRRSGGMLCIVGAQAHLHSRSLHGCAQLPVPSHAKCILEDASTMHFKLKWLHSDCAGPLPIWIHGRNYLSGQRTLSVACPSGDTSVIVRPIPRCFWGPHLMEDGDGSDHMGRTSTHALGEHDKAPYTEVECPSRIAAWGWVSAYWCT